MFRELGSVLVCLGVTWSACGCEWEGDGGEGVVAAAAAAAGRSLSSLPPRTPHVSSVP